MSEEQVILINSQPGIKRDGTTLDGDHYNDGQWVRFQRGRPKKIAGFRRSTNQLTGPVREMIVWSRGDLNAVHCFSSSKIEALLVDGAGIGNGIIDRTPAGFTPSALINWTVDTQYDDAVASQGTVILAHASESMGNIDDTTASKPFLALATGSSVFVEITDAPAVSGGIFSVAPYTFVYGSDGFFAWSDQNQPQVWPGSSGNIGDAGADRITGAKIVRGLPLRSGSGVAALLWSIDSVLRMDYIGGQAVFRFSHLTTQSSVLSANGFIEYDGAYFWPGMDRFLVCDGSKVDELPNAMNQNWFFDNLNYEHRQKVWATKVPRYGEIWWFYPRGDATECTHAVIFNVREKVWYDTELPRTAGWYSQVLSFPMWANADDTTQLRVASVTNFEVDDVVVGSSTLARGTIQRVDTVSLDVILTGVSGEFELGETVVATSGGSSTVSFLDTPGSSSLYSHEQGWDAVAGDDQLAIQSYFTTADFGLPSGGPQPADVGINRWTRLTRVEPDFIMDGDMTVTVIGNEFAQASSDTETSYNFTSSTGKIDMREQHRQIQLKFESNIAGGYYEMGRVILHTEPGDVRS